MKIKALSKFWYDGRLIAVGTVMDMPDLLVSELVSSHKAERVHEPIAPVQPTKTEEVPDGTAAATRPHKSK